ncbi:reverse transcriptase domain-containing protein [Trichonephila clavipes]|nr:reverse transcriptase domain-containing protein [Trichonephila clavipes]
MERVIHRTFMNWLIENKKLHFYQTAFRTHHSTTDQLFYLSQSIIDGFQEKPHKKTLAVFLDISAAFDRNSQIKKVDLPTYLGVTLDPELRFSKNIEQTANKALGKLNILRKLCGTSWGSNPKSPFTPTPIHSPSNLSDRPGFGFVTSRSNKPRFASRIHTNRNRIAVNWKDCYRLGIVWCEGSLKSTFCTVIRPVLEYATPIWTPASISVKRKLDSVQHRAAKIIIGAVSSTNNEKAEQECGLPPIESRRNLANIKFTNKLRSYGLDHISRRVFYKWKNSTRLKRSSTLQLDSEIRKELNLEHSSLEFLQEPLIPKKPTKEHLFRIGIVAAMF